MMKTTDNRLATVIAPICLLGLLSGSSLSWAQERAISKESANRLFSVEVMPLLRQKCLACHGDKPQEIKGKLDLGSRAGMLKGG